MKIKGKKIKQKWTTKEIEKGMVERQGRYKVMKEANEEEKEQKEKEYNQAAKQMETEIVEAKRGFFQRLLGELPKGKITDRKEGWGIWDLLKRRKQKQ